jgi:hypothetical protein
MHYFFPDNGLQAECNVFLHYIRGICGDPSECTAYSHYMDEMAASGEAISRKL